MKNSKRILVLAACVILAGLLMCTFLSRTIFTAMQPRVTKAYVETDRIQTTETVYGVYVSRETRTVYSPCDFEVDALQIQPGAEIKAGDAVLTMNGQEIEDRKRALDLALLELQIQGESWLSTRQRNALNLRIAAAQSALDAFQAKVPEDGILLAAESGEIAEIAVHAGQRVSKGDELYTYSTDVNVEPYIECSLPTGSAVQVRAGDTVQAEYEIKSRVNGEEITQLATADLVVQKTETDESGNVIFRAAPDDETVLPLSHLARVKISVVSEGKVYDQVVPLTAVSETGDGLLLYVLRTRDGLFGEETYVQAVKAKELARNYRNIAIQCDSVSEGTQLVLSTDHALADGEEVQVIG